MKGKDVCALKCASHYDIWGVEGQHHTVVISAVDLGKESRPVLGGIWPPTKLVQRFLYLAVKQLQHKTGHSPLNIIPSYQQGQGHFFVHTHRSSVCLSAHLDFSYPTLFWWHLNITEGHLKSCLFWAVLFQSAYLQTRKRNLSQLRVNKWSDVE
jgi:hypothetical protein